MCQNDTEIALINLNCNRIVTRQLNIIHTLGFPIDYNGNLQRSLFEALHVALLGENVKYLVSEEVIREGILAKSVPEAYFNGKNLEFIPVKPLIPVRIAKKLGWRINNLIVLPLSVLKLTHLQEDCVLHVHAPTPVTKPFAVSVANKLPKRPLVLDFHDPWSGNPFSMFPIQMLQTGIMRYAINRADAIITAHRALIELVRKVNDKKPTFLIPNGVDTNIFQSRQRSEALIKTLNFSSQDIIVAFSGHITEEKGLDTLAYAAKIVTQQCKNIKFLIIGDGPTKSTVQTLVNELDLGDFFRFTGFISAEEFTEHLSLADICVAPYKPMPFQNVMQIETPLKVVQCLSMSKPTIMSKVSSENVVSWSGGGTLVPPDDPQKLADEIIYLAENEKLRDKMGKSGRDYVKRNLDWASIAVTLSGIYKSLL